MTDHTTMSKVSRVEVMSPGARRRWTLAEKRRIVAESYGGPGEVSATARRHGLSGGQLFTWRRLAREGRLGDEPAAMVPVEISAPSAIPRTAGERGSDEAVALARASKGAGLIAISMPCAPPALNPSRFFGSGRIGWRWESFTLLPGNRALVNRPSP
jgi:transposase